MSTQQLGWAVSDLDWSIVAGVDATQALTATVTQANGTPLPSYEGWTCRVAFYSPYTFVIAFVLRPIVTGDGTAHTLTAPLIFVPATTAGLAPGVYTANAIFIDVDGNTVNCPATIRLTVEEFA